LAANALVLFSAQGIISPLTSTWPHLRCDVGLEEGGYRENCLSCSIVYYYNGAQRYKQFLQVGQLYQALILLSLVLCRAPLCLQSSRCYICIKKFLLTSFSLPFSELSLVRLALDLVDLTIILQCYDTVGWVVWPVKSSPKWPIMSRVGR